MTQTPEALFLQSRYDETIAELRRQLATPLPQDAAGEVAAGLAEVYVMLREWMAAGQTYIAAINAGGTNTATYICSLTTILMQLGEWTQALAACDMVAQGRGSGHSLAENQIRRARILNALNRSDEARAAVELALDHDPTSKRAQLWRRLLTPPKPGGLRVVDMLSAPAQCRDLLDAVPWFQHPNWVPSEFIAELAPFLNRDNFEDLRFVVVDQQGHPLLRGDVFAGFGGIHGFGGPVRIRPAAGCTQWGKAATIALDHLMALEWAYGGGAVIAELPDGTGRVSPLGLACLKQGGHTDMTMVMDMDLTRPEAELWSNLRKSYRPLITAGDKRFHLRVMNRDNPDWSLFECYRVLHYLQFPNSGAELMFAARSAFNNLLERGQMELLVGFDGERPISATMIIDEAGTAQYYSARYVRDAGLDVGPWALWNAVRRSRDRGLPRFHLGYHDFHECENDKMRNIAFFKAGFAQNWHYQPIWRLAPST